MDYSIHFNNNPVDMTNIYFSKSLVGKFCFVDSKQTIFLPQEGPLF